MAATATREAIDAEHERLDEEARSNARPPGAADDPANAQDGLFDRVIEDEALEAVLEEREKRRAAKKAATAKFKEKHDVVKGKLDALDLEDDTIVRCGRFRVKVTRTAPRSVAFETGGSRRMTISLLGDNVGGP